MPKLPRITARKLIRLLQKEGFYIHHQRGSHVTMRHLGKPHLRLTVPNHNRDLAPKTLQSILVQAEMTVRDLIDLL